MSRLRALLSKIPKFTLTTPSAVLIGACIIGASIISYGFIVRPVVAEVRDYVAEAAKQYKLKGSQWESCLASDETMQEVANEYNDGVQAEVTGTPTTFVVIKNGDTYGVVAKIEGAQDESFVRAALEEALSGKAKTTPFKGAPLADKEFVEGSRGNVYIIEYADAECPFCVRFHPTLISILADYQDRVGFVYRHFPLSQIHPNATRYALAIECAGKLQGVKSYFGFMDYLLQAPTKTD